MISQAWLQVAEKYGEPTHLHDREGKGFAVIGYGKVGGWELGYNSDLDIVFMQRLPGECVYRWQKRDRWSPILPAISPSALSISSRRGRAQEFCMKLIRALRPSGASGLLVSPTDAFDEYQHKEAWTWEHQALVRARMIYGDEPLANAFYKTRGNVLSLSRDRDDLRKNVVEMREKMRNHLGGKKAERFMLKQDAGGITDIEFLAQYLVLSHSHDKPKLARLV